MEFSFKIKVNAKKEEVWKYYSNIEKWYIWEEDLKNISLNGKFQTGIEGIMELEVMPPIKYILTSVKENAGFWDKMETPLGDIYFGHEIFEDKGGFVEIKHTVKLESEEINKENIEFLKQIFLDVPYSMLIIKKVTEK